MVHCKEQKARAEHEILRIILHFPFSLSKYCFCMYNEMYKKSQSTFFSVLFNKKQCFNVSDFAMTKKEPPTRLAIEL